MNKLINDTDISFVCCIEAGVLEEQTIRMVASLRAFGGAFSVAPIYAVTPRFGPRLSAATLRALRHYEVVHLVENYPSGYEWFNFLNKPLALLVAEKYMKTSMAAWLDGDLLFVAEPAELLLGDSEDFAGFPVESKEMGSTGPGDPYESLWQRSCNAVEVDIESLPFVVTAQTNERVRLYFNGGIFVYRRSTKFAESYHNLCVRLLDSRIGTNADGYNVGFKEMSAIGFAVIKMKLRWRALPYSHDYVMLSSTHATWYSEKAFQEAKILHYHDAMWPHFWPVFLDCLKRNHAPVARWLGPLGPMQNRAGMVSKTLGKIIRFLRKRRAAAYARRCTLG